jgi:hypothetical protein
MDVATLASGELSFAERHAALFKPPEPPALETVSSQPQKQENDFDINYNCVRFTEGTKQASVFVLSIRTETRGRPRTRTRWGYAEPVTTTVNAIPRTIPHGMTTEQAEAVMGK